MCTYSYLNLKGVGMYIDFIMMVFFLILSNVFKLLQSKSIINVLSSCFCCPLRIVCDMNYIV